MAHLHVIRRQFTAQIHTNKENSCRGPFTALPIRWACHVCELSDAIRFTSLLPSHCQGEPTACMGLSQMCELQVDVGKEPPDWPHHLQGYI